jgi:hypothetical protein
MKICFVTHYEALYGANRSLLDLIEGLKKFKVESFVLAPRKGGVTTELEKLKVPYYVCRFSQWMAPHTRLGAVKRLLNNIRSIPFLLKQVKKWNPDVIYTNSSVTPIGLILAKILRKPFRKNIKRI